MRRRAAQVAFIRYVMFGSDLQQIQKYSTTDVGLNNITPNLYGKNLDQQTNCMADRMHRAFAIFTRATFRHAPAMKVTCATTPGSAK